MSDELIKRFEDKVWATRKARIMAAERLRKRDVYTKFITNYYSLLIVVYSILGVYPHAIAIDLSLPLIIASIILFGASLYISSMNYSGRANDLKSCYIKLDTLLNELRILYVQSIDENEKIMKLREIEQRYSELLSQVENHSVFDYWEVIINAENNQKQLTLGQRFLLYGYKSFNVFVFILLLIIPIILPLFFWRI